MMLTAEAVLAAADLKTEAVEVPEWGGVLRIRELTLEQQLAVSAMRDDPAGLTAWLVAAAAVDEAGAPLFADTAAAAAALRGKSASVVSRLAEAVLALSGLANSIEDAAGN